MFVNIYVERFADEQAFSRAVPFVETSEGSFSRRIRKLDYYLYKDGVLVESGPIEEAGRTGAPHYTFSRKQMPWGEYKLALIANCTESVITGSFEDLDGLNIVYPGIGETDDYFIGVLPITINENKTHEYDAQLKRLHGVVRYNLIDIDPEITAVEVSMDGLTCNGCMAGTYSEDFDYSKVIYTKTGSVLTEAENINPDPDIVGTFPTMEGGRSSWSVRIYKDDPDTPFYERTISTDIAVVRNRLLDLSLVLEKDNYSFRIAVDADWDGKTEGGIIIIN